VTHWQIEGGRAAADAFSPDFGKHNSCTVAAQNPGRPGKILGDWPNDQKSRSISAIAILRPSHAECRLTPK